MIGGVKQSLGRPDHTLDVETYPTTIRENMVGLGQARRYEFVADTLRERDIYEVIPVHVTNLSPPQTIFGATKAMSLGRHPGPTQRGTSDLFARFQ